MLLPLSGILCLMTWDIFSQSLHLKLPRRLICSNPSSASKTCTPSTFICELCHLTCCVLCVCVYVCVHVCVHVCVCACVCVWERERERGGGRERERMRDVGCICWCCTVHGWAFYCCVYCPSLFSSFFLLFFCTARRALVYTRGSRLICISLLSLLHGYYSETFEISIILICTETIRLQHRPLLRIADILVINISAAKVWT